MNKLRLEIIIHILIWLVLFLFPFTFTTGNDRSWNFLFNHFWLQLLFLAIVFYFNYLYMTRFLFSEKKAWFFIANILLLFLAVYIKNNFQMKLEPPFRQGPRFPGMMRGGPPKEFRYYIDFLIYLIPVAFSVALKSGKKIQQAQELKNEAKKMKLESELIQLKYQLQPHFFFNAMNNIYSLIDIHPDLAKSNLHNLSKLMRFLLQKSNEDLISLNEEISFLKRYIDLMSIRIDEKNTITTHFPEKVDDTIKIAPLLFISIVENAFKHGISSTQPSFISFSMEIKENKLYFTSVNPNFPKQEQDNSGSGIGLDNLKKRLALLYNDDYEFVIKLQEGNFIIVLSINL